MVCLKCGKNTTNEQVFCDQCLAVMDAYPVKPDMHIQLPNRASADKKPGKKKRAPSPEELVILLRRKQRRLKWAIALLALALCVVSGLLLYQYLTPENMEWGKNYIVEIPFP